MIGNKRKPAFTLVEVIVAMSLFAVLAVMTVQVFINVIQISKKVEIQQYVFTEAEAAMEKILREISRGTIDYDEYYSHEVLGETDYGQNYGAYKAVFYSPGDLGGPFAAPIWVDGGDGVTGSNCDTDVEYFPQTEDCEDFVYDSYDSNEGQHYYSDILVGSSNRANAVCTGPDACWNDNGYAVQQELYLIDSSGSRKMIIAIEDRLNSEGDSEYVVSMLEMTGDDLDGDAITDYWGCDSSYDCDDRTVCHEDPVGGGNLDYEVPNESVDLSDGAIDDGDFEPITPANLNIVELTFFIAPLEDPYRAFSEDSYAVQQHPHVIVTMTVAPSYDLTKGMLGTDWTLTLQGVASTVVFDEVPSEYKGEWRWTNC